MVWGAERTGNGKASEREGRGREVAGARGCRRRGGATREDEQDAVEQDGERRRPAAVVEHEVLGVRDDRHVRPEDAAERLVQPRQRRREVRERRLVAVGDLDDARRLGVAKRARPQGRARRQRAARAPRAGAAAVRASARAPTAPAAATALADMRCVQSARPEKSPSIRSVPRGGGGSRRARALRRGAARPARRSAARARRGRASSGRRAAAAPTSSRK